MKDFGNLISVKGRMGRVAFAVSIVVLIGAFMFTAIAFMPATVLFLLPFLYVFICLMAKRLHDMGISGWFAAVPFVAAVLLALVSIYFNVVTSAFCQGFCANASETNIAVVKFLGANGEPMLGWFILSFTAGLCILPPHRAELDAAAA